MSATAFAPFPAPVLTPVQEHVIGFIAAGISITKTAAEFKIHRNTIGHWRRTNPAFAQALADAQYERTLYWRDEAEDHAALAIFTIGELLSSSSTPPSIRLRAALAMLRHATTVPTSPAVHEIPQTLHNPAQMAQAADRIQPTAHDSAQSKAIPTQKIPQIMHNST